jgi:hypothetical protein
MARFSGVYAGLRPLRRRADTAGSDAIGLGLGSGMGLLLKRRVLTCHEHAPLGGRLAFHRRERPWVTSKNLSQYLWGRALIGPVELSG